MITHPVTLGPCCYGAVTRKDREERYTVSMILRQFDHGSRGARTQLTLYARCFTRR